MQWIEMENPIGKRVPRWQRSAGISDDGIVFVPGAMTGNEQEILLCAAYDGTSVVSYLNHLYVPSHWLAKEFPKTKEVCELIERKIKEIVSIQKAGEEKA